MSQDTSGDKELMRVLSNPENLIISEALLERLPGENISSQHRCLIKFGDIDYVGTCQTISFKEETLLLSLVLDSNSKKFKFLDSNISSNKIFESRIIVTIDLDEENKTFSGIPKEISYDQTPNSSCTMRVELYNYWLEDSHE